jgi:hypothetical protein
VSSLGILFIIWILFNAMKQGKNIGCCGRLYRPDIDFQHFCLNCKIWYHQGCLGELASAPTATGDFKKIIALPIIRGRDPQQPDFGMNWRISGNGRRVLKARELEKKDNIPEDWKEKLGEVFVADMLSKEWSYFACPTCNTVV